MKTRVLFMMGCVGFAGLSIAIAQPRLLVVEGSEIRSRGRLPRHGR